VLTPWHGYATNATERDEERELEMSDEIERLSAEWLKCKEWDAEWARMRVGVETQLAKALAFDKPEGSKTHKVGPYHITLTQPINRKVDPATWDQVRHLCSAELHPVKWKPEPDVAGIRYLILNNPEIWAQIAPAFEAKLGKIGVKIEEVG
jgi:hypothetical protein